MQTFQIAHLRGGTGASDGPMASPAPKVSAGGGFWLSREALAQLPPRVLERVLAWRAAEIATSDSSSNSRTSGELPFDQQIAHKLADLQQEQLGKMDGELAHAFVPMDEVSSPATAGFAPIRLLSLRWLFERRPKRIQCRQELERDFQRGDRVSPFISASVATRLLRGRDTRRHIFVLSHAWQSDGDADPTGVRMAEVIAFIEWLMRHLRLTPLDLDHFGLFWDMASLYQKPRCEAQERSYQMALANMSRLFGSAAGTCVLQSESWPDAPAELAGSLRLTLDTKLLSRSAGVHIACGIQPYLRQLLTPFGAVGSIDVQFTFVRPDGSTSTGGPGTATTAAADAPARERESRTPSRRRRLSTESLSSEATTGTGEQEDNELKAVVDDVISFLGAVRPVTISKTDLRRYVFEQSTKDRSAAKQPPPADMAITCEVQMASTAIAATVVKAVARGDVPGVVRAWPIWTHDHPYRQRGWVRVPAKAVLGDPLGTHWPVLLPVSLPELTPACRCMPPAACALSVPL